MERGEQVKNLAELKRYLSTTGERLEERPAVRLVSLEYRDQEGEPFQFMTVTNSDFRGVAKVQTNLVIWEDGNRLDFPNAKEVEFDSSQNTFAITRGRTRLTYKWANTIILN
jgi:hypothetical protein